MRGFKVSSDDLTDYLEGLVRNFLADRGEGETFAEWSRRAEEEKLK